MHEDLSQGFKSLRLGYRKLRFPWMGVSGSPGKPDHRGDATDHLFSGTGASITAPTIIERVFNLVKDNSVSLVNVVAIVIVLVVQITFRSNWFTCPCIYPQSVKYSVMFIIAPSLALFIVGILASNVTWQIVTGSWRRQAVLGMRAGSFYCAGVLTRAMLGPLAWIIFGLLDGKFYECAGSRDPCSSDPRDLEYNRYVRTQAQIAGCGLLIATVIFSCTGLILWRCCSRMTYEHKNYMEIYRRIERAEIEKQFEEHAQDLARQNILAFLERETKSKKDWDTISGVPGMETRFSQRHNSDAYSLLHKHINDTERDQQKAKTRMEDGTKEEGTDTVPIKLTLLATPNGSQRPSEDPEEDEDTGEQ